MSSQDNKHKHSMTYLESLQMSFQDSAVILQQEMKAYIYLWYIYLITQTPK